MMSTGNIFMLLAMICFSLFLIIIIAIYFIIIYFIFLGGGAKT